MLNLEKPLSTHIQTDSFNISILVTFPYFQINYIKEYGN